MPGLQPSSSRVAPSTPSGASLISTSVFRKVRSSTIVPPQGVDLSASVDIFLTREARAQHETGSSRLRVELRDLRSDSSVGLITLREDSCDVSIPERRLAVGVLSLSPSPSTGSSYVAYTGTM